MNLEPEYATCLWDRALQSLATATENLNIDPDAAANRAYYAAFNAVSALFALEGQYFRKHSGLRSSMHKLLIHTKRISEEIGADYDKLLELRGIADYGASQHVSEEKARASTEAALRVLQTIHTLRPDVFPMSAP